MSRAIPERAIAQTRKWIGYVAKKSNRNLGDFTANAGEKNHARFSRDDKRFTSGGIIGMQWRPASVSRMLAYEFGLVAAKQPLCKTLRCCTPTGAKYFKSAGRYTKCAEADPQPDDVVFFFSTSKRRIEHVGIVTRSAYQTIKDAAAAKLAKNVKLVIRRASVDSSPDAQWPGYAKLMRGAGAAYGAYRYVKATTAAEARVEARLFWQQASPRDPHFCVADIEWSGMPKDRARAVCSAFIAELKRLGARKTGVYVGHHLYKLWNLDCDQVDFVRIPRYGGKATNLAGKWAYPAHCTDTAAAAASPASSAA